MILFFQTAPTPGARAILNTFAREQETKKSDGSPADAKSAKDLLRVLTELDLLRPHPEGPGERPARRVFEATGDPEAFTALATRFLGPVITGVAPAAHRSAT